MTIKLDNKEIYKKTLGFSVRRLLWDMFSFVLVIAFLAVGFVVAKNLVDNGLIGLAIGLILGLVVIAIITRYVGYSYKAGQIAMMTRGIVDDKLPEDVVGEGKKIVKERFATVAAYFAITNIIKGIFSQIGRGITAVGKAVGGENGGTIGNTISSIIQTVVAYLCDCCLGWVFYRNNEKAGKATLEGAVLFFKHGKTLAKNLGRVFGISLISFLVIGGIFTGISYLIFMNFPDLFAKIASEIAANGKGGIQNWLSDPNTATIACSVVVGVIFWGILHSAFVRPFILVGVLRNYINSGINDIPSESAFDELDEKSKKFKELHEKVIAGTD